MSDDPELPPSPPEGPPPSSTVGPIGGPQVRPWPALTWGQRVGPLAAVAVLVIGLGVVATTKGRGSEAPGAGSGTGDVPAEELAAQYVDDPALPVSYQQAADDGTLGDYDWGDRCDPETGRNAMPSVYAPPCVPAWGGDEPWRNQGGEVVTSNEGPDGFAPGVSEDEIVVAYYVPSPQDISATLQAFGVLDEPELATAGMQELIEMGNGSYELYGRKVVLEPFQASGDGKSPASARADARKVADDIGAFASIGGPTQTSAYQDELARQGVLCIACGYSTPGESFQDNAPYSWAFLPSPDQLLYGVFDFGAKNLFGQPAQFAGDPAMRDQTRRFGVVHYEQDPPVFGALQQDAIERYREQGYSAEVILTYLLDLNTLPKQAQAIVGRLKREGITTVVFLGDPLMPKYLTEQATAQDYFPEWVVTGTVFTDTTAAGRLYDQEQWAHAFGASSLPARTEPELSPSWQLYEWWFGRAPEARKTLPIMGPPVQLLFNGLQGAGPWLSAETFAGAMFRYPPSGGGPTTPRISFGQHGLFEDPDWVGIDDFTNIWWDAEAEGPDEQDVEGTGMWRYAVGGARLQLGEVPEVDDDVLFGTDGAVTILDEVPPEDQTPDYPPLPGSPAAEADDAGD